MLIHHHPSSFRLFRLNADGSVSTNGIQYECVFLLRMPIEVLIRRHTEKNRTSGGAHHRISRSTIAATASEASAGVANSPSARRAAKSSAARLRWPIAAPAA